MFIELLVYLSIILPVVSMTPVNIFASNCRETVCFNECLRSEILEARNRDQRERQKVIEALRGSLHTKLPEEIENAVIEIDQSHNSLIKEVICRYGWPGFSLVGEDGSDAFWLLVQHQDRDIELQIKCLSFLEEAVKNGEASRQNLAYLTDRVRTNQGKPQLYGTQWNNENGKLVLQPVENPELLDERRKDMNLPTIEEYKKSTIEGYKLSEDAFK